MSSNLFRYSIFLILMGMSLDFSVDAVFHDGPPRNAGIGMVLLLMALIVLHFGPESRKK